MSWRIKFEIIHIKSNFTNIFRNNLKVGNTKTGVTHSFPLDSICLSKSMQFCELAQWFLHHFFPKNSFSGLLITKRGRIHEATKSPLVMNLYNYIMANDSFFMHISAIWFLKSDHRYQHTQHKYQAHPSLQTLCQMLVEYLLKL